VLLTFARTKFVQGAYQAHGQEHIEKRIECQAKTRPPVRHTGVVDKEAMDEVKNAVPNKDSDY
jgi:hypothetical protein